MAIFELTIGLLLAAALLARLARWLRAPYPSLLALAGVAAAFIPGAPDTALDPSLALALFVAPTLLDAAYDASPRDLRANWASVLGLALLAVGVTVAAVAVAARALAPQMPWAAAVALGAIVAPPDASAAAAVLRQVRLPHRLSVVLEGESLFNDATALLIYRFAVTTAMTGVLSVAELPLDLVLTCGGGALLGITLARLHLRLGTLLVEDLPIWVTLQFLTVFGVWLLAEALHLSAIITVVAFAMTLSRLAPLRMDARRRISSYAVWEVVVFVLNALAFLLIGLQLRGVLDRVGEQAWRYAGFALAVLVVVIVVRFAWTMAWTAVARWRGGPADRTPTARDALLVSWCGMRGIVTLAAALALPEAFPFRDLIVLSAVAVSVGTLVLQGLTLRPLLERLAFEEDRTVAEETRQARIVIARAALRALESEPDGAALPTMRKEFVARLVAAEAGAMPEPSADVVDPAAVLQRVVATQRRALEDMRRSGRIGDDAFHVVEEELDMVELSADSRLRPRLRPDGETQRADMRHRPRTS